MDRERTDTGKVATAPDGAQPSPCPPVAAHALPYASFNQLRSFHAVAVTGSVTGAAALLHVSQPTVTIQLRRLESYYGVELVRRGPRGLRLSSVGESLYALTEQLFALHGEAVELLNSSGSTPHGQLRVGGVAPYFVMRVLAAFTAANPGIAVTLELDNSTAVIDQLIEQRVDVGVVGQDALDSRLHALPCSRQRLVLFCHQDHPWSGRDGVRLAELAYEPLVMRERGSMSRFVLERELEERGISPHIALEVGREGVREAVVAGFGVGITTEVEYVPDGRTWMLPFADADIVTEAFAVCLRGRRNVSAIRAFMRASEEIFDRVATHR